MNLSRFNAALYVNYYGERSIMLLLAYRSVSKELKPVRNSSAHKFSIKACHPNGVRRRRKGTEQKSLKTFMNEFHVINPCFSLFLLIRFCHFATLLLMTLPFTVCFLVCLCVCVRCTSTRLESGKFN